MLVGQIDGTRGSDWSGATEAAMRQAGRSPAVEDAALLWRLSRYALAHDQVRAVIESCDSWQVPFVLQATVAGRELLCGVDAYDERYRRHAADGAPVARSWIEDPTTIVESLRDVMRRPDIDAAPSRSMAA